MDQPIADVTAGSDSLSESDLAAVPDEALINGYLHGDQLAFEALYMRHKGPLYRYLMRQLPPHQAEEAFQETWLKIIKALPGYTDQGRLQAYLFRICHNVLMDVHRANMRHVDEATQDEVIQDEAEQMTDGASDVVTQVTDAQLHDKLCEQLARLPVAQRAAWILKHETQLSVNEIAELTDSTAEGVKSRLRYATDKLKLWMQNYV